MQGRVRSIIRVALAIFLALGLFSPVLLNAKVAWAADMVARLESSGVEYMTIAEAVAAITGTEDTITLLAGSTVSASIAIPAGKTITIVGDGSIKITGASPVSNSSNAATSSLFVVSGNLNLQGVVIENTGIGVRTIGEGSTVTVTNSNITSHYYALALRNINQSLTVSGSTLTAWAGAMTSAGDFGSGVAKDTNSQISISDTTINSLSRSTEQYGAIVLQENYNGVTLTISNVNVILGLNPATPSATLAGMAAIDMRTYDTTVTINGMSVDTAPGVTYPDADGKHAAFMIKSYSSADETYNSSFGVNFTATGVTLGAGMPAGTMVGYSNSTENPPAVRADSQDTVMVNSVPYVSNPSGNPVVPQLIATAENVSVPYDGKSHTIAVRVFVGTTEITGATILYWDESTQLYDLSSPPSFTDVTQEKQTIKFQASMDYCLDGLGVATLEILQTAPTPAPTSVSASAIPPPTGDSNNLALIVAGLVFFAAVLGIGLFKVRGNRRAYPSRRS